MPRQLHLDYSQVCTIGSDAKGDTYIFSPLNLIIMLPCSKCGTPLNEDAKFCSQCGQAVAPEMSESYNCSEEQEVIPPKRISKKIVYGIIALATLLLLIMTCPTKQEHVEAVQQEITSLMLKNSTNDQDQVFAMGLGNGLIQKVLLSKLDVDSYLLFSVGSIHHKDKSQVVSVGVLGHVFAFDWDEEAMKAVDKMLKK